MRDLLSKNPNQRLEVKETPDKGVHVKGLVQFVVKSVAEINSVLQVGVCVCTLHTMPYTGYCHCLAYQHPFKLVTGIKGGACDHRCDK